ncbi:MAG: TraR/DksA family transcriptional regulator [Roseibium sp.]|nr:TraR/DksA family transcriptional regulator [Roseibium sp.]
MTRPPKKKLLALKAELEALSDMSEGSRATVMLDQQAVGRLSRMDALQGQAMAQAAERQRRADLVRIDAALRRLETGDYGCCLECGEDIAEKRLDIDPAAALCVNCAN